MDVNNHNTSNETNTTTGCHYMTHEDFRTATAITIGLSSFTCLICTIAIFLIIFLKAYSNRSTRLVFYLNLTIFGFMCAEAMQILPLKIEGNVLVISHEGFCTAAAFFDQFFATLVVLTQFSMAFYLLSLINSKNKIHNQTQNKSRVCEVCGVTTAVTVAIIMATIPLIPFDGDTMYGVYGINCWIQQEDENCEQLTVGIVEAIVLWYLPFAIAFVFMDITLVFAVRALCKKPARNLTPSEKETYMEARKEARVLTFYLSVFTILYFINTTLFIIYYTPQQDDNILWHAGSAVHSLLWLSVPASFIFHPATLKKLRCSGVKQAANKWRGIHDDEIYTSYHVPADPEFPECNEELVIRGSDRHKRHAGYHTMLEKL